MHESLLSRWLAPLVDAHLYQAPELAQFLADLIDTLALLERTFGLKLQCVHRGFILHLICKSCRRFLGGVLPREAHHWLRLRERHGLHQQSPMALLHHIDFVVSRSCLHI